MTTLSFREWTTQHAVELTPTQRDALMSTLRADVRPVVGRQGQYDVTPGNTIGTVVADGVQLLVKPKISINQVLFLLGYVADPTAWRVEPAELTEAPDVVSGMASLFSTLCERALRRGLLRGYHDVDDDLATVRGRIDLAEQLRRRPGIDLPLAVRYVEHDEDVIENRLILAATRLFRGLPVRGSMTRRKLHRLVDTLHDVTPVTYRPPDVPAVSWTRLNEHYRPAVTLAQLLLRLRSVDLAPGATPTAGLAIDMAVVFEEFVRSALREELRAGVASFPPGHEVRGLFLDANGRVPLQPDLSYWPRSSCAFVGDAKYKRDPGGGQSADLYQLLAYATATRLPEATLIYAEGPPGPRAHVVPGADVLLRIEHVDLSQPPDQLLAQVRTLADGIRQRAAAATLALTARRS